MKKYLMMGVAALAFASCSNKDVFDQDLVDQLQQNEIVEKYNKAFIRVFGEPAANQTWGFGTAGTRAVFSGTWNGVHTCFEANWENRLSFTKPTDAVDVTSNEDKNNKKNFYVPEGYTGEIGNFNIPDGGALYNYGTITAINGVNYSGVVTFYNAGTINDFAPSTAGDHDVINIGTLTITKYSNIGNIYNGGTLVLAGEPEYDWSAGVWPAPVKEIKPADIPDDMHIYSNGAATIEMPDGGDLKAVCDIHSTLNVTGNVKIQNSMRKYICGIVATGTVENTDGPLETSYVKADLFTFDGNPIYLLPGGHVDVTTLKVINSGCEFYGADNSTGLVEAVNYEFGNKNDFTHTFSNNIYFKVNGGTIKVDNCYAHGQDEGTYTTVEAYLANTADELDLAKDRINAGNATGSPACGNAWTVGTPNDGDDDDDDDDNTGDDDSEFTFLCRVFCEDLSASNATDFDFNDVVFDVFTKNGSTTGEAKVVIKAAGGTLPLKVAGYEVHELYNVGTGVMVNTGAGESKEDVELPVLVTGIKYISDVNDKIVVEVEKEGAVGTTDATWVEMWAKQGQPAAKFAVKAQIDWANERQSISKDEDNPNGKYANFKEWVQNAAPEVWWE